MKKRTRSVAPPKQRGREIKVWVRPTLNDELILYGTSTVFNEAGSRKHLSKTIQATLLLPPEGEMSDPLWYNDLDDEADFGDDDGPEPGEECGRWDNGRLTHSCTKSGSEECDFECPYRDTLYKRAPKKRRPR